MFISKYLVCGEELQDSELRRVGPAPPSAVVSFFLLQENLKSEFYVVLRFTSTYALRRHTIVLIRLTCE
jgi:hypothetical protein